MPPGNVPSQGVAAREGTTANSDGGTAAREMDAREGASTRGARRFAIRGVSRMTPTEREAFWAEEARRCGFKNGKSLQFETASSDLLICRGQSL